MTSRLLPLVALLPFALATTGCDSGDERVEEPAAATVPEPPTPGLRLERESEAREVFRRAFWRNPAQDDRIVHAERREWLAPADGVRHWQWFLELEPGADFTAWFEDENPFGLAALEGDPLDARRWPDQPPAWFPSRAQAGSMRARGKPQSLLTVWTAADGRLFATDRGGGFVPTAP